MSEATIAMEASDLLSLHANFKPQGSTTVTPSKTIEALDELGNIACQRTIEDVINYTNSFTYCGTDFVGDLGTALSTFGALSNGKIITQMTANLTAENYVKVDFTFHNHIANAHAASVGTCNMVAMFPNHAAIVSPAKPAEAFYLWDGFGVPNFGVTVGANASPKSATVTLSLDHKDAQDQAGEHLIGKSMTPRAELKMDFEGIPTSNTKALLVADFALNFGLLLSPVISDISTSDSNTAFDSFIFTAKATPALI